MTIHELVSTAAYLAWEWDLSECEHDDLISFGAVLARRFRAEVVRLHMEARAEVLSLVGSEMEGMYEAMRDWFKEGGTLA